MSSSENEQDDNNVFDQLKDIRAFTVEQLYSLYPDVECPRQQYSSELPPDTYNDPDLHQDLVEYEQHRRKLASLRTQVKQLHTEAVSHIDEVWTLKNEVLRKTGMCQHANIAHTTFEYKQAFLNLQQLDLMNDKFSELSDMISIEYIRYSFESQMKRYKISTQLSSAYQIADFEERMIKLRSSISTLIDFMKHLGDSTSDFVLQCRKWLRALIKRFLEMQRTEDYKFIISQLCKGPVGTAQWSSDLIECKPFGEISDFESTPRYISHCSALLTELFIRLKGRVKRVTISTGDSLSQSNSNEYSDQKWSVIDPRFSCSEELNLSSRNGNILSENDVIKFCHRIPVAQIFRAYVKKCLEFDDFYEMKKDYKNIMLKLLKIGTIIIRTYQIGLETFNSILYGSLIEYLSSQIRRTVIVLSDQWAEFKRRLEGVDNTLFMRLQVEYDNFILRSTLIILELRQSGIWRHLSRFEQDDVCVSEDINNWSTESIRPAFAMLLQVTGLTSPSSSQSVEVEKKSQTIPPTVPKSSSNSLTYEFSVEWFKEVSDPMLWHILLQFYHNAFVSSCDYNSDNYWLEKFREKSIVYLFVNKIRDSPPSECSYLLNSITSMLLSRNKPDSNLVSFIATEIFNLSFKHEALKHKITKKGVKSLIKCAEKFPNLISLYMSYMVDEDVDDSVTDLIRGCSLTGWICNDDEMQIISKWLVEYQLDSTHNKVARLLISKILLNSPEQRLDCDEKFNHTPRNKPKKSPHKDPNCYVDLRLRRKLSLLLYETSVRQLPETNEFSLKSLGTFVEVALGDRFCENSSSQHNSLLELAVSPSYQKFYVWVWRLLITFRLHILNQPETDWNDLQSRSGTSRSIKNTVLLNDSFYPVPSLQDSECIMLSEGVRKQNHVAAFIYMSMTDATWQLDMLDTCLNLLNSMSNSGHLTPSLMIMEFLTICYLNDLNNTMAKDQRCFEYFTTIITSSLDATRMASLIFNQLYHLKQYRQLQLSQFYITTLLEVTAIILKQISSSWFSGNEHSLEKITSLLDYIVKFNFTTQRLEIIRKFYDCSYSIQSSCRTTSSWFNSFFATTSPNSDSSRRELLTSLHVLTQKFKKYHWLRWVTTECDTLKLENIWEKVVVHLSTNEQANLDTTIKKVCPQMNPTILKSTLPIYSWIRQIFELVELDPSHPLCPLIWYNFYLNYFANPLNGVSVGLKLVPLTTRTELIRRLESLFNYHLYKSRNWSSTNTLEQNFLELYRAYKLWLDNISLLDAYVDIDSLGKDYLGFLLKRVIESSTEDACIQYIDIQSIDAQNRNLCQIWLNTTRLESYKSAKNFVLIESNQDKSMNVSNMDDEVSDVASLIGKSCKVASEGFKSLATAEDELRMMSLSSIELKPKTIEETIELIKQNFRSVLEESSMFESNISEFNKTKLEFNDTIQQLYTNKKVEHTRIVQCSLGYECSGPAKIKFDVEEATIDDRISECIQDRRQQCEQLVDELLQMPTIFSVKSTIIIENNLNLLVKDTKQAKSEIESLFKWISEPDIYRLLNGSYYVAERLLKAVPEILSTSDETDTYNTILLDVCFEHPESVQIFSPHLSPSACSNGCFLDLYKKVSTKHTNLSPEDAFVLLSKFDVNNWLKNVNNKELHHEIIKTTCAALRELGKQPDESYNLTFGLYKLHIHVELASPERRQPKEISIVLTQYLNIMNEQSLASGLWIDFMSILGLEKHVSIDGRILSIDKSQQDKTEIPPVPSNIDRDEATVAGIVEDITRLADRQMIFDYHAINGIMDILIEFVESKYDATNITLLELYQDYLDEFSLVILGITFIWLRSVGEHYPDNHDLTYNKFTKLWYHWVYLSKNCQNVGKASYSLIASHYVAALRYMIQKMPENTQMILHSVLSSLANYVQNTKKVVYLELTILQRCLKNLPWSSLVATPSDFENMAVLSEQENYNISDLVSHILMHINLKNSLGKIHENTPEVLPYVAERLATTIVLQSNHLKGFRLHGCYFTLIPVDQIQKIASLILSRMEFVNLEHSQNNKLLVNLLRFMCIKLDASEFQFTDSFDRSIIFAKFVSDYLIDLIKSHPSVVKYHQTYLYTVMDSSLRDLKILLSPDVDIAKKTAIYERILECCSDSLIDQESRFLLAKSLIASGLLKDQPIVVMEIFQAIGHIINDSNILVYTIERLIVLYLNMNGHYEKVWKCLSVKVLPSDMYLDACVKENTPLALLTYFEAIFRNGQDQSQNADEASIVNESLMDSNKILSCFFHWISQLSAVNQTSKSQDTDIKLITTWLRLLHLLEPHLEQFIHFNKFKVNGAALQEINHEDDQSATGNEYVNASQPMSMNFNHKFLLNFIKQLISMYDSYNSSGLWSYLKSSRSEQSSEMSLIALAVACFLSDRTLTQCYGVLTESGVQPLKVPHHLKEFQEEISRSRRLCLSKLEAARKSKHLQDHLQFIEALIESINRNDKVQYSESVQLIVTFVKSNYSDESGFIAKILSSFDGI